MTLQTFRHVPNEIQAVQYTGSNAGEILDLFGLEGIAEAPSAVDDTTVMELTTAHGDIAYAREGDWIVPDSKPHTFYPILSEVMDDTYVPVVKGAPTEKLTIEWPYIVPEGTPITKSDLKAGWSSFMTPLMEAGRGNEPELKSLLGVFRAVYGAMPTG